MSDVNEFDNELDAPFIYGKTVSSVAFTNREDVQEKLLMNLTQGINTMLISPRRWGKSSLVEHAMLTVKKKHPTIKVVMLDLFTTANQQEFLELFAREVIKASSTKWEDWMQTGKSFFKQIIPKLSVGLNPSSDFEVQFDWKELQKYPDEVLSLPDRLGQEKKCRFIVCIDEFQNLVEYDDFEPLEKKMRAIWQKQKHTSYCLYGSKRHMMTAIFNKPSRPFYRFGDIILLGKIERNKWTSFIQKNFKRTGKIISKKNAELIPTLMNDHSWYVQQLANYTWQKTNTEVSEQHIQDALQELIYANSPLYQREIEILSKKQVNLLKAIAKRELQLSSAETMQRYDLGTSASVVKNRTILEQSDVIHELNGRYEFLDPAFELWFNKVFFGVKI